MLNKTEIDTLDAAVSRLRRSILAANKQIPGFYNAWLGDSLLNDACLILDKLKGQQSSNLGAE